MKPIELSVASVDNMIKELDSLKSDIEDVQLESVKELLSKGEGVARSYNNSIPHSNLDEGHVFSKFIKGSGETRGHSGYIVLQGAGAIFDEFGTGEMGAANPHPLAGELNFTRPPYSGYITGPMVKNCINPFNNMHYWIIPKGNYTPSEYVKEGGYTEGIPAGKPMYRTAQYLHKITNDVVVSKLNDELKKHK